MTACASGGIPQVNRNLLLTDVADPPYGADSRKRDRPNLKLDHRLKNQISSDQSFSIDHLKAYKR